MKIRNDFKLDFIGLGWTRKLAEGRAIPEKQEESTPEEFESKNEISLLEVLRGLSPIGFEKVCRAIELVDGNKLVEMFQKAELGLTKKTVFNVDLKYFESFE